jgi:hypothetical protein
MDIRGGHSSTSPDGKWTVSVLDGVESGIQTVTMEVFQGDEPTSRADKAPVMVFTSPLPGFDARASATKNFWSPDGKECHLQLAAYHGEASLIVVPSESRVEFDPLTSFGYIQPVDPTPLFLMFGVLLLAYIFGMRRLQIKGQQ